MLPPIANSTGLPYSPAMPPATTKKLAKKKAPIRKTASVRSQRIGWDLRDPLTSERAIAEVVAAFEAAAGAPIATAELLGVAYEQVRRWTVEHPALQARLDAVQKAAGWVRRGPSPARRPKRAKK